MNHGKKYPVKVQIRLEEDVYDEMRRKIPARKRSRFMREAIRNELRRQKTSGAAAG